VTPGQSNSKPHSNPMADAVELLAHVVDDDASNNLNISIFAYLTGELTINILYVVWLLSLRSTAIDSSPIDAG
jgi:hypothetical protein